jgi:hypothetical protein
MSHCIRSYAPALLTLFASGWCIQYHIPTAESIHYPEKRLGFVGLCTVHHMMSAEVDSFAYLCASLLQVDGPSALLILDPTTGEFLEHHQLHCDPHFKATWDTLYANELGCLCPGIGSGDAPSAKRVAGTNIFFLIEYQDILAHKRKKICHTMVVCEVFPQKG